jgi:uncharacterized protein (DUF1778 family)
MREKGKMKKEKKILIRVNKDEKKQAEMLAQKEGKNTSEFFRSLLREHSDTKMLEVHLNIVDKYESVLGKYRELLTKFDKNKDN